MPETPPRPSWVAALRLALALALALVGATRLRGELVLVEPGSTLYYRYAAVAGADLRLENDAVAVGDVHANTEVRLHNHSRVEGNASAVGTVTGGTVTGMRTAHAAALGLPALPDEPSLRALADRTFERSQTFRDAEISDIVFVDGDVRIEGDLRGTGTIMATGEIRLRNPGGSTPPLAPETRLSFISLTDIRLDGRRQMRGTFLAGRDIELENQSVVEGVLIAHRSLRLKNQARVTAVPVDVTPPVISLISPADGSQVPTPQPSIEVHLADDLSGVDVAATHIFLDGGDATAEANVDAAAIVLVPALPLTPGEHELRIATADLAGNAASATFHFTVLSQGPPSLQLHQPEAGPFYGKGTLTIAAELAPGAGIDLPTLVVRLDGVAIPLTACELRADALRCEVPDPPPGTHVASASFRDLAGVTVSDSRTFELLHDAVPPTLAILRPTAAVLINQISPVVELAYGDADSGVDPLSLSLTVGGVEQAAACSRFADHAVCQLLDLGPGPQPITASIADRAGNLASASAPLAIVADSSPPTIVIEAPLADADTNQAMVVVSGTVLDDQGITEVRVNGQLADLSGTTFSATVPLVLGQNRIVAQAADTGGNIAFAQLGIDRSDDTTPPRLAFIAPAAGSFVVEPAPQLRLSFADPSGVDAASLSFSANGATVAASCAVEYQLAVCDLGAPLPGGPNVLVAHLDDAFGNRVSATTSFVIDPEPVMISIDQPLDRTVTRESSVEVSGSVSPPVSELEVNGVPAVVAGGQFSATVPIRPGTSSLVAFARKANGNSGTASLEVIRDEVAPIVRIDSPRDGFVATTPIINVGGLVNDIVRGTSFAEVRINGVPALVGDGSFLLTGLRLAPGSNHLEAVAIDGAGNAGSHAIDVVYAPPSGPTLTVVGGNGQSAPVDSLLPQRLEVEVRDAFGAPLPGKQVQFVVRRNSGLLRQTAGEAGSRQLLVPTDGNGRAAVLFQLGETTGVGMHRVVATAVGVAGEVEICATATHPGPQIILMSRGDHQTGATGRPLPMPFEALVADRAGNPIAGVPVTFTVEQGGGHLDGAASITRTSGIDGIARAVLTLGATPGLNNNVVLATYPDIDGLGATFVATALAPGDPAATSFKGVVVDNAHEPIPGATVSIGGTALSAVTDAAGQFHLDGVPAGAVHIHIDPSTSSRTEVLPPLAFEAVMVAGQVNDLGQPISLPFLQTDSQTIVGGAEDVVVRMPGVDGLELTVFANSVTFPDGSHVGPITISQVQLDKVPMPPPNGTFFMPPAWTIQPHGVHFDPPARISIPNDGMRPGRIIDIYQFDHGLNQFINVGKGTTTEDAAVIVSDPGFGITDAGWGGCGQPPPPDTCADGCDDKNQCTTDTCRGNCVHTPLTGNSCDDGMFCTEAARCNQGECKGEKKKDKTLPSLTLSINFDAAFAAVKDFLRLLMGDDAPDFQFNVGVNVGLVESCCEEQKKTVVNQTGSVQAALGFDVVEIPLPWSFTLPRGFGKVGFFLSANFTFSGSGTWTKNSCTMQEDGQAQFIISLTGTGDGRLEIGPASGQIVEIAAGFTTGAAGGVICDKTEAGWDCALDGNHLGLVFAVTFELFNGVVETTTSFTLIEPGNFSGSAVVPQNVG